MVDLNKRRFLRSCFKRQAAELMAGFEAGMKAAETETSFEEFFDSYESSYALTLAYPDEILMESARAHGIQTAGREKIDIVRELFKRHGGYGDRS